MKARAWDIETTIDTSGRSVSPFRAGQWTVAMAWVDADIGPDNKSLTSTAFSGGTMPYSKPRSKYWQEPPADGWLAEVLDGVDLLIGANIKFDLGVAQYRHPENTRLFRQWVKGGGRVWDVLNAEYTLRGAHRGVQRLSLDDVCVKYGGKLKEDQVKAMWAAGVDTPYIPYGILMDYLKGTMHTEEAHPGDVGNTMLAFLGQIRLKQYPSMSRPIALDMLALLCALEMEINGIHMDVEKAEVFREEAIKARDDAYARFVGHFPEEHRPFINPNSRTAKSALLFGGTISYTRKAYLSVDGEESWDIWPEGIQDYPKKTVAMPLFNDDGSPLLYKSGRNAGNQKTKNVQLPDTDKAPKTRNVEVSFTLPRLLTPPEGAELDDGTFSTSGDVLDAITENHQAIQDLRDVQLWTKDVSTSYWVEDSKGNRKGLMTKVGPDGIIHQTLRMNTTNTQRMSCESPNAQQFSKKSRVKEAFTSRFDGGTILQPDFTSLESYSVALLTGDPATIRDLQNPDFDMHCSAVAFVKGVTVEEAVHRCKGDDADPEWKALRQTMKGANFAYEYGAGATTIARQADLPLETAERFIDFREKLYPTAVAFKKRLHATVNANVRYTGEEARCPDDPRFTYRLGHGLYRGVTGRVWAFELQPSGKAGRQHGITESVPPTATGNYPFQGTGCDWMKGAMALAYLYLCDGAWGNALLICTVHDALYVDSPADSVDIARKMCSTVMAHSNRVMEALGVDMKTDVPYSIGIGPSWGEEHDGYVEPLPNNPALVASIFEYRNHV